MLHARKDYQERIQDSADIIPKYEPVFLLRGQDAYAPDTVDFWADLVEERGGDKRIVAAARDHAIAMRSWQEEKACKMPDMP